MAKKRKPVQVFDDDLDEPVAIEELDILETCGQANAAAGRTIYQRGLVSQRSFDGEFIHGAVQEGNSSLPVVASVIDFDGSCTDVRHLRRQRYACEHLAALMYAYLYEPESFLAQNADGFPEAPAPVTSTPADELKSLMRMLSREQLGAIATRRGWKLSAAAKDPIIDELAVRLANSPLPAELSSEEEQLLRLENTLYGLTDIPEHHALQDLWHARAGGDMVRFQRALNGLQSAGVLFRCTQDASPLHYHWLPFLRSEDAPHLAPKAKLYPAEKIAQLKQAEPLMPLTTIVDAVIELAEREPLPLRPPKTDPRFAGQSFADGWELDEREMEQIAKTRVFPNNALTITFPRFWTAESQQALDAIWPEIGPWAAAFLLGGNFFDQTGGAARSKPEQARLWRAAAEEQRWRSLWLGWQAGAAALTEMRLATERASLVALRTPLAYEFKPQVFLAEVTCARQLVARLLAPLDPLVWYSFKSFAEYVRGVRADFLHTTTTSQIWFLAAAKTRHRFEPSNAQHWEASYRVVLAAILDGPLRWMGVTEAAYEGDDLAAFRITPLGASLLSGGAVSASAPVADSGAPPVVWLDDFTLRLAATPDAARAMAAVRAFAEPTREPLTFRVSNGSVARALERGISAVEIAGSMENINAPLPKALREKIEAFSANYGRVRLYEHLTVVEFSDDFALRELLAGTRLAPIVVHQLSPRLVVVREEGVDGWLDEAVKKGYTPRMLTTGD